MHCSLDALRTIRLQWPINAPKSSSGSADFSALTHKFNVNHILHPNPFSTSLNLGQIPSQAIGNATKFHQPVNQTPIGKQTED
jgi:hypothetical protein